MDGTGLRVLTEVEGVALRLLCERIVPGSVETGAVDYVDRLAFAMPAEELRSLRSAIAEVARATGDETAFERIVGSPSFELLRSLVIEAYYGDYTPDDFVGVSGWKAIDFAPPGAARLAKDWGFLDRRGTT